MGEARRKKLSGNTAPSNPNWKRRPKRLTRGDKAELTDSVMLALLTYPRFPRGFR